MLEWTIATIHASQVERMLLVVGHAAARLDDVCPWLPRVVAEDHAEGLAATLRRGIAVAERDGWAAALVCLGDMPLVRPRTIDRLIEAYDEATGAVDAVVPLYDGARGNPVLWDRRMFSALRALQGDRGGRALLAMPGLIGVSVQTDDPGVLADFDTPERLAAFAAGRPH